MHDPAELNREVGRLQAVVKSLRDFDDIEVKPLIMGRLSLTEHEKCFVATHQRGYAYVGTLVALKNISDFQTISSIARSLFELSVDIALLANSTDAAEKMDLFVTAEKLRRAKEIIKFAEENPTAGVDVSLYKRYVDDLPAERAERLKNLWGPNVPSHWSGMKLGKRLVGLPLEYQITYIVRYPQLSWHVHPGLQGVVNLKPEIFSAICGMGFAIAMSAYANILSGMIAAFKLTTAMDNIRDKLVLAKMLPFADSPERASELTREILG